MTLTLWLALLATAVCWHHSNSLSAATLTQPRRRRRAAHCAMPSVPPGTAHLSWRTHALCDCLDLAGRHWRRFSMIPSLRKQLRSAFRIHSITHSVVYILHALICRLPIVATTRVEPGDGGRRSEPRRCRALIYSTVRSHILEYAFTES